MNQKPLDLLRLKSEKRCNHYDVIAHQPWAHPRREKGTGLPGNGTHGPDQPVSPLDDPHPKAPRQIVAILEEGKHEFITVKSEPLGKLFHGRTGNMEV
jgi:hypothetical protein